MCEMATLGMPVITSDIPVCHEVLDDFENVSFIKNDNTNIQLKMIYDSLAKKNPYTKNEKYYNENTSYKEVILLNSLMK